MEQAKAAKDKAKESRKKGRKDDSKNETETKSDTQKNGKDNTTCGAFSNHKWAGVTDRYDKEIFKHLGLSEMEEIMSLAQATRVDEREHRSGLTTQVDLTLEEDDLVEGSDASSECAVDDDPLSGWLRARTKDVHDSEFKNFLILPLTYLICPGTAAQLEQQGHLQDQRDHHGQSSHNHLRTAPRQPDSGSLTPPPRAQRPCDRPYSSSLSHSDSGNEDPRQAGKANVIYVCLPSPPYA